MKEQHNIQYEKLARYFAGEMSEEESEKMKLWIKADPKREKKVQSLYRIWEESSFPLYKLDIEEAWTSLSRKMDEIERSVESTSELRKQSSIETQQLARNYGKSQKSGNKIHRLIMTLAAAAVVLVAGLFNYYNYGMKSEESVEVGKQLLEAQNGERTSYLLNDGSKIVLHAGSRLEVPLQFNKDVREVFLEGEAYFEVAHDATKPFIVYSENAYTRVLGTKFLVQGWSDNDDQVRVIVTEGRVALGSSQTSDKDTKNEAIINRNQLGVLTGDTEVRVSDEVDLNWYMGWTRGKLKFDNRPLKEVIPKLELWYDIDIKLTEEDIGTKKITAEIDYSQPMSEVLKSIALTLDLEVDKNGRIITYHVKQDSLLNNNSRIQGKG